MDQIMLRTGLVAWLALAAGLLTGQDAVGTLARAEALVEARDLRSHVEYLASDELEGRMCGARGNEAAARYIAEHYRMLGLAGGGDEDDGGVRGYYQFFSFSAGKPPRTFRTRNVIAGISGREDEAVVLGAHFDHVGTSRDPDPGRAAAPVGAIFNGADDNASGTSALLAISRALVKAQIKPRRSIVFAHFNGEEWGLKGSEALLARPGRPFLGSIVAHINFDMIGRNPTRPVTIKGAGSSPGWEEMARNASEGMDLSYRIVLPATGNTDYLSFLKRKIPSVGFFTELHADYHNVGDRAEKLDYPRMEKIVRMALRMTLALSDASERPSWSRPPGWKQ